MKPFSFSVGLVNRSGFLPLSDSGRASRTGVPPSAQTERSAVRKMGVSLYAVRLAASLVRGMGLLQRPIPRASLAAKAER